LRGRKDSARADAQVLAGPTSTGDVGHKEGFGSVSKTKLFQTPWNFLGLPDVLA
jgi:hypothetical protein